MNLYYVTPGVGFRLHSPPGPLVLALRTRHLLQSLPWEAVQGCLSVSAESSVTGKQTHLTLKQRRFEPCGSTYTRVFFSSEHYGTPGSAVGGGTEDVEGQL